MKARFTSVAVCIATVVSLGFSQDVSPSLGAGSKAMLFTFSGLSFLGANAFDGGFGAKYYLAGPLALRAGLQFTVANQDIPANPPAGVTGTDGSRSATGYGISAAVEYHFLTTRVSPYVGGGLSFNNLTTETKSAVIAPATQTITKNSQTAVAINGTNYTAGMNLGVGGLAGVEFFVTKEISLSGEYQLGYTMTSHPDQEVTNGNTTVTTQVGGGTTIGIGAVGALTLAVYF
jgi:opacity protein-like surface antigen